MAYQISMTITGWYPVRAHDIETGLTYWQNIPYLYNAPTVTSITGSYNQYSISGATWPLPIIGNPPDLDSSFASFVENCSFNYSMNYYYGNSAGPTTAYWELPQSKTLIQNPRGILVRVSGITSGTYLQWVKGSSTPSSDFTLPLSTYDHWSATSDYAPVIAGYQSESATTPSAVMQQKVNYVPCMLYVYGSQLYGLYLNETSATTFVVWPYTLPFTTTEGVSISRNMGFLSVATDEYLSDGKNPSNITGSGTGFSGGGSSGGYKGGNSSPYQYNSDDTDSTGLEGGDGTFQAFGDALDNGGSLGLTGLGVGLGVWIYQMNHATLANLTQSIFADDFITLVQQFFAGNFENAILRIYNTPFSGASGYAERIIHLGSFNTNVTAQAIPQHYTATLGEVTIPAFYGSFMDYSGTRLYIYLPFVGFRELSPDKYIQRGDDVTLKIEYSLDFLSGAVVYKLITQTISGTASNMSRSQSNVLDIFSGSMASDIPIGGASMRQLIQTTLGVITNASSSYGGDEDNTRGGNPAVAAITSGISAGASAIQGFRKSVTSLGTISGNIGALGPSHVFLVVERATQHVAAELPHYIGYQTNKTLVLGDTSGYVQCEKVYLDSSIPNDDTEEVISQLRTGVYI